ncbi:Acidic leucine-rich nuclear phosphoprotein 32 like protein, partial [Aduncisulcus paluster]
DLSNNSISDVSVLLTSDLFPADALTTLDISSNNICDIDNVVTDLQSKFTNLSTLIYSDQTCHCSASVSSSAHQVCREVYPDRWAVECWNGYYLDESTGECVEACGSQGYSSGACVGTPISDDMILSVCANHPTMMPVLAEGGTILTCGCRAAWRGDNCDELYKVYIPDEQFRKDICYFATYGSVLCDISEYELASLQGEPMSYGSINTSYEGAEYLINIDGFYTRNELTTSIFPVAKLEQLIKLYFYNDNSTVPSNSMDIHDFDSLYPLHRLQQLAIYGNERIYDISVSFRNISMNFLEISDTSYSVSTLALCRSESDEDYWSIITTIFPVHDTDSDAMSQSYLPNSCPLNEENTYSCDPTSYPTQCPSFVLNEVYDSTADTPVKKCASIAKTSGSVETEDLTCYTIHDDMIRNYLKGVSSGCIASEDDIESNGIISVATLRSKLECASLSLSDVVSYSSVSSVNDITTLQGLEYAQGVDSDTDTPIGLTSLTLDGYDLSGDINDNAEYDKLVVRILSKAVTAGDIDSGLTHLSVSGCGLNAVSDVLDLTPINSYDTS